MKSIGNIGQAPEADSLQGGLQGKEDKKLMAREMETVFLNEFLKIMLEQTTFGKDKTVSTYLPVLTSEIAKSLSERGIGIGDFLTRGSDKSQVTGDKLKTEARSNVKHQAAGDKENSSLVARYSLPPLTQPVEGKISSGYGMRNDPFDGTLRLHNGLDIAVPEGTPIRPAAPGKVIFSGNSGGYGNCVVIEHENGLISLYAHNSANSVKAGDVVDKDKIIGFSGSTGRTTGPHLHFEVRRGGIPLNPEGLFG